MAADRDRDRIVPPEAEDRDLNPDPAEPVGTREDELIAPDVEPEGVRPVPERGSSTLMWVVGALLLIGLIAIVLLAVL